MRILINIFRILVGLPATLILLPLIFVGMLLDYTVLAVWAWNDSYPLLGGFFARTASKVFKWINR